MGNITANTMESIMASIMVLMVMKNKYPESQYRSECEKDMTGTGSLVLKAAACAFSILST